MIMMRFSVKNHDIDLLERLHLGLRRGTDIMILPDEDLQHMAEKGERGMGLPFTRRVPTLETSHAYMESLDLNQLDPPNIIGIPLENGHAWLAFPQESILNDPEDPSRDDKLDKFIRAVEGMPVWIRGVHRTVHAKSSTCSKDNGVWVIIKDGQGEILENQLMKDIRTSEEGAHVLAWYCYDCGYLEVP